jgi:hypothetical protein
LSYGIQVSLQKHVSLTQFLIGAPYAVKLVEHASELLVATVQL